MEIRIPQSDLAKWNDLVYDLGCFNIDPRETKERHTMRNGIVALRVCLFPSVSGGRYQKRGFSGRRVFAVCFHGHYLFLDNLFKEIPEAKVRTVLTERVGRKWMDSANFEQTVGFMAQVNVGSLVQPQLASEACDCE